MRVITAIYLHCRPELRDEWLCGGDVDGVVEEAVAGDQVHGVGRGDPVSGAADHHCQFPFVVERARDGGQHDRHLMADQGVGEAGEDGGMFGRRAAGFDPVLLVVQPHAEDLAGFGDHGQIGELASRVVGGVRLGLRRQQAQTLRGQVGLQVRKHGADPRSEIEDAVCPDESVADAAVCCKCDVCHSISRDGARLPESINLARSANGGGGFGGPGGPGGFGGDSSEHRYNLTVSINARNILNHENLNTFNGSITSPYFLQPTGITGGYGAEATSSNQRRMDLQIRFSF